MDHALRLLSVVSEGAKSNWWGLSCPAHCGSLTFPVALWIFISGLLLGILACIFLGFWLGILQLPRILPDRSGPSEPQVVNSRLRAYLDESSSVQLARRR